MNPGSDVVLPPALRGPIHAVAAVVLASGLAWLALHSAPERWVAAGASLALQAQLLKLHGAAAMLALVGLGAVLASHALPALRRPRNRVAGILLLSAVAALALTGWCLYYVGDEDLRAWASDGHIAIGAAAALLFLWHAGRAKKRRKRFC